MTKKISVHTQWFPANTTRPTRKGFYQVTNMPRLHHNNRMRLNGPRRYWDGKQWCGGWMWLEPSIMGTHPSHFWRGFTTKQS